MPFLFSWFLWLPFFCLVGSANMCLPQYIPSIVWLVEQYISCLESILVFSLEAHIYPVLIWTKMISHLGFAFLIQLSVFPLFFCISWLPLPQILNYIIQSMEESLNFEVKIIVNIVFYLFITYQAYWSLCPYSTKTYR